MNSLARIGDVLATVLLTALLIALVPINVESARGRIGVFVGIVVAVPTVVCAFRMLIGRVWRNRGLRVNS